MRTITYSQSRQNYAATLDSVVMVALDDYESLKATAYLLQNPANARRLLGAIERLEFGDASCKTEGS